MSWDFVRVSGPYGGITEGPAWDGSGLLFTNILASRIMRYDPATGTTSEFRTDTNHANGLMLDSEGRLYACEGGARRVVRYEPDGSTTVLADSFEGKRFNQPNDLAIDLQGAVWFTDPLYEGGASRWSETGEHKELDHDSVYRLDPLPDGDWSVTRETFDTTGPNGILFSLDHRTLYVAQTGTRPDEKRELRAYPVRSDRSLGPYEVLHDFGLAMGIDGMCLDTEGNIMATAVSFQSGATPSIYVFSPSGEVLERHPLPVDNPTNCTFGGPNLTTLYITTGEGRLFQVHTERQGRLLYPPLG